MWGLAMIYNDTPNPEVGAAVEKAMDFFAQNSKLTPDGHRYVTYRGMRSGSLGTVALCVKWTHCPGQNDGKISKIVESKRI